MTRPLRIVHCFRAPVGGLFRHVRDLAEAQAKAGHKVAIVCDSITGGVFEETALAAAAPHLALGLRRFPMRRQIAPSDIAATWRLMRTVRALDPDILHGHGAKGGGYARVIGTLLRASGTCVARIYSPHGGSLHYDAGSLAGRVYFTAERVLERATDAFAFVSRYEAKVYADKVGPPHRLTAIVPNGLRPEEFEPVAPGPDAADFLYIGALRDLKGVDTFIEALVALTGRGGGPPTAVIVGDGPDKTRYEAMVRERGLAASVAFRDPMPARTAFALAGAVVIPSRAESMPYIVLEAIAAGMPVVATRVGGIPEIFGDLSDRLVPAGDSAALAGAMAGLRTDPAAVRSNTWAMRERLRQEFSVDAMSAAVLKVYDAVTLPRE